MIKSEYMSDPEKNSYRPVRLYKAKGNVDIIYIIHIKVN